MVEKIFLSHNFKDKSVVEPIAVKLADVFGKNNVFYDSWSINPGDGIIDKMNEGLSDMTYFLFFISRNSLESEMVKLEWQNALYKAAKGHCKFIPIKIDDCVVPPILLQNLYIDFYNYGFDVGLSQLIDVIKGSQPILASTVKFSNVVAEIHSLNNEKVLIILRAIHFQEPIARFLFLFRNNAENVTVDLKSDGFYNGGHQNNITLSNGLLLNGITVGIGRALAPSFPIRIELECIDNEPINGLKIMRAVTENTFEEVQVVIRK